MNILSSHTRSLSIREQKPSSHSYEGVRQSAQIKKPILIIFHQENSDAGAVGQWFQNQNYPLDIRRPRFDDALPETLEHHSGVVVFGGPMSANDNEDYVKREIDWLGVPLKENKPLLGICLGAQMLVKHLGGEVRKHHQDLVEVGYYPITPTNQGQEYVNPWPSHFYQFHTEGFELPSGATCLAQAERFETQAFSYSKAAYALQFHPEVTLAMVNRWTILGADRLDMPGAQDRTSHLRGHYAYSRSIRSWLDQMLQTMMTQP